MAWVFLNQVYFKLGKKEYQVQLNRNVKYQAQIDKGYSCVRFGQKFEKIAK